MRAKFLQWQVVLISVLLLGCAVRRKSPLLTDASPPKTLDKADFSPEVSRLRKSLSQFESDATAAASGNGGTEDPLVKLGTAKALNAAKEIKEASDQEIEAALKSPRQLLEAINAEICTAEAASASSKPQNTQALALAGEAELAITGREALIAKAANLYRQFILAAQKADFDYRADLSATILSWKSFISKKKAIPEAAKIEAATLQWFASGDWEQRKVVIANVSNYAAYIGKYYPRDSQKWSKVAEATAQLSEECDASAGFSTVVQNKNDERERNLVIGVAGMFLLVVATRLGRKWIANYRQDYDKYKKAFATTTNQGSLPKSLAEYRSKKNQVFLEFQQYFADNLEGLKELGEKAKLSSAEKKLWNSKKVKRALKNNKTVKKALYDPKILDLFEKIDPKVVEQTKAEHLAFVEFSKSNKLRVAAPKTRKSADYARWSSLGILGIVGTSAVVASLSKSDIYKSHELRLASDSIAPLLKLYRRLESIGQAVMSKRASGYFPRITER